MDSDKKSILSPALFALVLLLFSMPFFEVSCGSQVLGTVSGYDLAFGGGDLKGSSASELGGATLIALVALGASVVGLATGILGGASRHTIGAVCGIGGGGLLLLLMMGAGSAASDASASSYGAVRISTQSGLMFAMTALFAAGLANALEKKRVPAGSAAGGVRPYPPPGGGYTAGPAAPPAPPSQVKFCPDCGTQNASGNAFCASCGQRLG